METFWCFPLKLKLMILNHVVFHLTLSFCLTNCIAAIEIRLHHEKAENLSPDLETDVLSRQTSARRAIRTELLFSFDHIQKTQIQSSLSPGRTTSCSCQRAPYLSRTSHARAPLHVSRYSRTRGIWILFFFPVRWTHRTPIAWSWSPALTALRSVPSSCHPATRAWTALSSPLRTCHSPFLWNLIPCLTMLSCRLIVFPLLFQLLYWRGRWCTCSAARLCQVASPRSGWCPAPTRPLQWRYLWLPPTSTYIPGTFRSHQARPALASTDPVDLTGSRTGNRMKTCRPFCDPRQAVHEQETAPKIQPDVVNSRNTVMPNVNIAWAERSPFFRWAAPITE